MPGPRPLRAVARLFLTANSRHSTRSQYYRGFSSTSISKQSTKKEDLQDRTAINTESHEYSHTSGDGAAAAQDQAAFDTNRNDPKSEKAKAGQDVRYNQLRHLCFARGLLIILTASILDRFKPARGQPG